MGPWRTGALFVAATTRTPPVAGAAAAQGPPSLGWSGSSGSGTGATKGRRGEVPRSEVLVPSSPLLWYSSCPPRPRYP